MKYKVLTSLLLGFIMSACGGGGGETAVTPTVPVVVTPPVVVPVEPTTFTGMFVDSAVEGLSYSTPTGSGVTNEKGEFTYQLNEKITFSLGGITFPEVTAKGLLTPLDIFNTTDINHAAVVNTLRLLQTLDTDGDAANGITISTLVRTLANAVTVDLSDVDFESKIADFISNSGTSNILLVSSVDAIYHFQTTLDALNDNGRCGSSHSKIGHSGSFSTLAHNVSGKATVIDNCTIEITDFSYDGGGPKVLFYAGIDNDYAANTAFPLGSDLQGRNYENDTLTITLPNNKTLDDLTGLSVWCADFNADFGNMTFTP